MCSAAVLHEVVILFFGSRALPIRPLTQDDQESFLAQYADLACELEILIPGEATLAWIEKSSFGPVARLRVKPEWWRTSSALPNADRWRDQVWRLLGADPAATEEWFAFYPGVLAAVLNRTEPGRPVSGAAWDEVRDITREAGLACLEGLLAPLGGGARIPASPTLVADRHPHGHYLFPWPITATKDQHNPYAVLPLGSVMAQVTWEELRLSSVSGPEFSSEMEHAVWISLLCGARYGQLRMAVECTSQLAERLRAGPESYSALPVPPLEEVAALANWIEVQSRAPSISRTEQHVALSSRMLSAWRTQELLRVLRAHARTIRILHRGRLAARQSELASWGTGLVGVVTLFSAYGVADQVLGPRTVASGPGVLDRVLLALLLLVGAGVVLFAIKWAARRWAGS